MDIGLGRFGDRRLEKGGPFCWADWLSRAVAGFAFDALAAIGLARSGSHDFCAIVR